MDASLIRQMEHNYGKEERDRSDVGPNELFQRTTKRQRKNCDPDSRILVFIDLVTFVCSIHPSY